jgi:nucleoside-triphosphatase
MKKNLFLTGAPGIGKTTIIQAAVGELEIDVGGFYTSEVRRDGKRIGFDIVDMRGGSGILARVDLKSPYRVGKYGVNRADLERVGVRALERGLAGSRLIVMDEIGRMELCSESFQEAAVHALDSGIPVLGTIQDRSNAFLDAVRARDDVEVVRLTRGNRNTVRLVVADRLKAIIGGGS